MYNCAGCYQRFTSKQETKHFLLDLHVFHLILTDFWITFGLWGKHHPNVSPWATFTKSFISLLSTNFIFVLQYKSMWHNFKGYWLQGTLQLLFFLNIPIFKTQWMEIREYLEELSPPSLCCCWLSWVMKSLGTFSRATIITHDHLASPQCLKSASFFSLISFCMPLNLSPHFKINLIQCTLAILRTILFEQNCFFHGIPSW